MCKNRVKHIQRFKHNNIIVSRAYRFKSLLMYVYGLIYNMTIITEVILQDVYYFIKKISIPQK